MLYYASQSIGIFIGHLILYYLSGVIYMKLIFCVEKDNGMMFFGKRHSQDRNLRAKLMKIVGDNKLWMSSYSAKQFTDYQTIIVDDDYMSKAGTDDYCFVENKEYTVVGVTEIILCNWNRKYPSDKFFSTDLKDSNFKRVSTEDIVGSSHKKITIEIWRRN